MEKNDISLLLEDSTEEEVEETDDERNESNLEEFLLNLWNSLKLLSAIFVKFITHLI